MTRLRLYHLFYSMFTDWLYALIKPLSWEATLTRDEYEMERDRQIVLGIYSNNIPGSLGGFAVIHGVSYKVKGYNHATQEISKQESSSREHQNRIEK